MQEMFGKYGIVLSERELILTNAAYAAGMSEAYAQYREAIDQESPFMVDDLLETITEKISNSKEELTGEGKAKANPYGGGSRSNKGNPYGGGSR